MGVVLGAFVEADMICEGGGPTSKEVCNPIIKLAIEKVSINSNYELVVQLNQAAMFSRKPSNLIGLEFPLVNIEIMKNKTVLIDA